MRYRYWLPLATLALLAATGCSRQYHPEYHPQSAYSYAGPSGAEGRASATTGNDALDRCTDEDDCWRKALRAGKDLFWQAPRPEPGSVHTHGPVFIENVFGNVYVGR